MAATVRAARTIGALAAALTLAVLLAQEAGAAPVYTTTNMHQRAQVQKDACELEGGKAKMDYTYTESGKMVTSITMTCAGGALGGSTCVNTPSMVDCTWNNQSPPLTRPEESPQLPGGGTNAPVPADDPGQGTVIVGDGTYATDPSAQDGGQSTTGQDGAILYAEDDQPATYPYGAGVETDEDAEPITTVQYRRIVGGDEEQP
jgi:hypothetical protein